jgi:hypothetical protein
LKFLCGVQGLLVTETGVMTGLNVMSMLRIGQKIVNSRTASVVDTRSQK